MGMRPFCIALAATCLLACAPPLPPPALVPETGPHPDDAGPMVVVPHDAAGAGEAGQGFDAGTPSDAATSAEDVGPQPDAAGPPLDALAPFEDAAGDFADAHGF
jgi:hypothetical protein